MKSDAQRQNVDGDCGGENKDKEPESSCLVTGSPALLHRGEGIVILSLTSQIPVFFSSCRKYPSVCTVLLHVGDGKGSSSSSAQQPYSPETPDTQVIESGSSTAYRVG